jgi:hypothetical protein
MLGTEGGSCVAEVRTKTLLYESEKINLILD